MIFSTAALFSSAVIAAPLPNNGKEDALLPKAKAFRQELRRHNAVLEKNNPLREEAERELSHIMIYQTCGYEQMLETHPVWIKVFNCAMNKELGVDLEEAKKNCIRKHKWDEIIDTAGQKLRKCMGQAFGLHYFREYFFDPNNDFFNNDLKFHESKLISECTLQQKRDYLPTMMEYSNCVLKMPQREFSQSESDFDRQKRVLKDFERAKKTCSEKYRWERIRSKSKSGFKKCKNEGLQKLSGKHKVWAGAEALLEKFAS